MSSVISQLSTWRSLTVRGPASLPRGVFPWAQVISLGLGGVPGPQFLFYLTLGSIVVYLTMPGLIPGLDLLLFMFRGWI